MITNEITIHQRTSDVDVSFYVTVWHTTIMQEVVSASPKQLNEKLMELNTAVEHYPCTLRTI